MKCKNCKLEMEEIADEANGLCRYGCCESFTRIYQCPQCKTLRSKSDREEEDEMMAELRARGWRECDEDD